VLVDPKLANKFHDAMLTIYHDARRLAGYNATRFLQMVHEHGALETAKRLLSSQQISTGSPSSATVSSINAKRSSHPPAVVSPLLPVELDGRQPNRSDGRHIGVITVRPCATASANRLPNTWGASSVAIGRA
jgi:hypothetical protein